MYFVTHEHNLRVILIKTYHGQISPDEAVRQAKGVLEKLENDIAKARERVDAIIPHLCKGTITVNEAEGEILLGE